MTSDDVVESVRWYVKYRIVMAVVGAVVFLIFLFAVIIPGFSRAGANDPFLPGGPEGVTCYNSHPTFGPDGIPTCAK